MPITSFLLQAASGTGGAAAGGFGMLLPLVLIIAIMYFFMIRPQNKKQKELQRMLDALQKGDKVVTIGGIHGTVSYVKKDSNTVIVKVDDNTKLELNRSAISSVVSANPAPAAAAPAPAPRRGLFGRRKAAEEVPAAPEKSAASEAETPAAEAPAAPEQPAADKGAAGDKQDE